MSRYKIMQFNILEDKKGFPVPDITLSVDDEIIHTDMTYNTWCSMLNSSDKSKNRYLNTMLSFLLLKLVLKAKAFHNKEIDYDDLRNWALEHINTKWNFGDIPRCSREFYEKFIVAE